MRIATTMTHESPASDQPTRLLPRLAKTATTSGLALALVGISAPAFASQGAENDDDGVVDLQILNMNDFHGRLESSAVTIACTAENLREQNDGNLILTSSGDNIGASTFTSFIQEDVPTLEALNAMGLSVSSLGNHEFDQGAADFNDRVIPLSEFDWIGANARDAASGEHLYEPYSIQEIDGVRVGFIGLNTQDMPRLVNPDGIEGIEWISLSEEVNYYAEHLTENDLADVVTVLVHEGLRGTSLDSAGAPFAELLNNAHPAITGIFSAHTHQAYVHDADGTWVGQGGEYGEYLVSLDISYDTESGEVVDSQMELIDLADESGPVCNSHPEVEQIVADAVSVAGELGSEVVAEVTGDVPFVRAFSEDGATENRSAASTIGELVANAQLWAVQQTNPEADFAITNSGGLRDDLPLGEVTVQNLGDVQSFANTLVIATFTGAQVYEVFEQQWREDQFSRHGQSSNVFYTYDPQADAGERISGIWIDGEPVDPESTYEVAMNSYMGAGGGGLDVAAEALELHDTGQNDLEAIVDYGRELGVLEPELNRGGVGLHWLTDAEASYSPGDDLELDVSSLAYAHPEVPAGDTLQVQLGDSVSEEFEIDLTYSDDSDERGRAEVRLEVPDQTGELPLVLTEPVTGTEVELSVQVGTSDEDSADNDDAADPVSADIPEILTQLDDHEDTGDLPVTTRGVVTGVYPAEGSYSGFYIQTEGTGGELDLEGHETSEAIFVHSPWTVGDEPGDAEVQIGDYVELTGDATVYEASGQKQISLFPGSDETPHHELGLIADADFDPVVPAEIEFPESAEARDSLMGMLIDPQGSYTVTDHYTLNRYGEIGIVAGEDPLFNPTTVVEPGEPAAELAAENSERLVYLDDGATTDFQNSDFELPYLTADDPVRVGADVEFENPVIVHQDFGEYRLQPTSMLVGPEDPATPASFENTREGNETPAAPAADLRIAGFNVLNYFVHLGEDEPGCEYFEDREGNPTTADWCDVRGAWSSEAFERQQTKVVAAINAMDADMVALQEVENSGHFHPEGDRDYAHARLVEALNEDLGYEAWDYVAEPEAVPSLEDEDVIRNGYIYKPESLEVTDSWILFDEGIEGLNPAHFEDLDRDLADIYSNAREPFAVEFQPVNGEDEDRFIAIVNHFKSKSASGVEDDDPNADQGDGQSPWNYDRIHQAQGVQAFADALVEATGTENVHLMGDFNSYENEDPLQVFFDQGYTNLSGATGDFSYMFQAAVGSLDHLISSPAAAESVAQTQIWPINAAEPIALEYSRHNGNASDIFRLDPWRSSDHDPIVADILFADSEAPPVDEEEDDDDAGTAPSESPSPTPTGPADPDPSESASATPTDAADPAPGEDSSAAPDGEAADEDSSGLAVTGAAIGGVVLLALLILGAGTLVLRLSRRELRSLD